MQDVPIIKLKLELELSSIPVNGQSRAYTKAGSNGSAFLSIGIGRSGDGTERCSHHNCNEDFGDR